MTSAVNGFPEKRAGPDRHPSRRLVEPSQDKGYQYRPHPEKRHSRALKDSYLLPLIRLAVIVLTACSLCATSAAAQQQAVDLELFLAIDVSGSVDEEEARLQRAGYVSAFLDEEVQQVITGGMLGRIAVTYTEWAGSQFVRQVVDWTLIEKPEDAAAFAALLGATSPGWGTWTSISNIIDTAIPSFESNGYSGSRMVIDVSGDGPNNDGRMIISSRDIAVNKGMTINGLPIINGRPGPYGSAQMANLDDYYEDCVIGGIGAFIVVANGFEDFGRAIRRKLVLEIAGLEPAEPARRRVNDYIRGQSDCLIGERILQQRRREREFDN